MNPAQGNAAHYWHLTRDRFKSQASEMREEYRAKALILGCDLPRLFVARAIDILRKPLGEFLMPEFSPEFSPEVRLPDVPDGVPDGMPDAVREGRRAQKIDFDF